MTKKILPIVLLFLVLAHVANARTTATATPAVGTPTIVVPSEARPFPVFDADKATDAYLAQMPAEARRQTDAYFEGGYWLTLCDFIYTISVMLLILNLRWSAAMRNLAERVTRLKFIQIAIYWTQFISITTALFLPLTIYENYFREHKYGLSTQTFELWMLDRVKFFLVSLVLGGAAMVPLFALVRRLRRSWWLWGSAASIVFVTFTVLIAPVYLVPIFNDVGRIDDPRITQPILSMVHANGISADDIYQIDASRQTTRISANVVGFGSTMRITLNDNLLRRAPREEIQFVVGHEMGHYVLHHIYYDIGFVSLVILVGFLLLRNGVDWTLQRWGERWQVRGSDDPAVLPLAVSLMAAFFFVLTPLLNNFFRTQEHEADMYGLNASRQPDGLAQAAIHLGEYRKMSPGRLEEWIFFEHPSGRNRIRDAMVWKSQNLDLFESQVSGESGQHDPPIRVH